MIANCHYGINSDVYNNNCYITTKHKYDSKHVSVIINNSCILNSKYITYINQIADCVYYTSEPHKCYSFLSNNKITSHNIDCNLIQNMINTIVDDLTLHIIIMFNIELNIEHSYKNLWLLHDEEIITNLKEIEIPRVTIIKTNLKDLIGYSVFLCDDIYVFSSCNICINNFIEYKYDNFSYSECVNLTYINTYPTFNNLCLQINALINYYHHNKYDTFDKDILRYFTHSYNLIMSMCKKEHRPINNINIEKCKLQINKLNQQYINSVIDKNDLSESLYIKQCELLPYKYCGDTYVLNKIIKNILKNKKTKTTFNESNIMINSDYLVDTYVSFISGDNWIDCINTNQCLGVLINIDNSKQFNINKIKIINTTITVISSSDLLCSLIYFLSEHGICDNGQYSRSAIMGGSLGKGNGIIPIFINNEHWQIAKNHIEECLSLTLTQSSYTFDTNMYCTYHILIMRMINDIIINNNISFKECIILLNLCVTLKHLVQDGMYTDFSNYKLLNTKQSLKIIDIRVALINVLLFDVSSNDVSSNDVSSNHYYFHAIYEQIKRTIYKFDCKKKQLFNSFDLNKHKIIESIDKNCRQFTNIYRFMKIGNIFTHLLNNFELNNGIIDEEDFKHFKFNLFQTQSLTFEHIISEFFSIDNEIVIENILLQSFVSCNNKSKYQNRILDILNTNDTDVIKNNNNKLKNIINKKLKI